MSKLILILSMCILAGCGVTSSEYPETQEDTDYTQFFIEGETVYKIAKVFPSTISNETEITISLSSDDIDPSILACNTYSEVLDTLEAQGKKYSVYTLFRYDNEYVIDWDNGNCFILFTIKNLEVL